MKKILLTLLAIAFFNVVNAQKTKVVEATCYQKFAKIFEKRGASMVEDGVYDNVIITFRKGSLAECYNGRVVVKGGEVNPHEMYLKFEDDSHEKIYRTFKYIAEKPVIITEGISRTMVTEDEELINVLFVKNIRPKKKAYSKAVNPDDFDF